MTCLCVFKEVSAYLENHSAFISGSFLFLPLMSSPPVHLTGVAWCEVHCFRILLFQVDSQSTWSLLEKTTFPCWVVVITVHVDYMCLGLFP